LIPGLRIAVAVAAGIAKVQFSRFVIYTAISATIWASTFMFIGWAIGDTWEEDREAIVGVINNPLSLLGLGIIVGSAVTVWIYRRKIGKLRWNRRISSDTDEHRRDESMGMGD
jgi:membrane protein DedA with SNARE-associated domain